MAMSTLGTLMAMGIDPRLCLGMRTLRCRLLGLGRSTLLLLLPGRRLVGIRSFCEVTSVLRWKVSAGDDELSWVNCICWFAVDEMRQQG